MTDKLRDALDCVHAEEELKTKTQAFLADKTHGYQKTRTFSYRALAPLAACLVLLLVSFGLWRVYFTPVSVISIDINPSLELGVNRFDRVVSVEGYNQDGQALADSLELRFLNYQDAVETVLSSEMVVSRLARDELLSIAVVDDNSQRCETMLANIQSCTAGHENAHCYAADGAELEAAHHAGLSYGKYQAFLEVQALDPDITPDDVQGMTMREIRQLIDSLSGQTADSSNPGTSGQNSGQGIGQGSGQGAQGSSQGQGQAAGQNSGEGAGHHGEQGVGHRYGQDN